QTLDEIKELAGDFYRSLIDINEYENKLKAILEADRNKARIDENESLLSVAEHEIELGEKCDNHDKHTPACYACRKRKMYVAYSKDWQKSIDERLFTLRKELDGGSDD